MSLVSVSLELEAIITITGSWVCLGNWVTGSWVCLGNWVTGTQLGNGDGYIVNNKPEFKKLGEPRN